MVCLERKKGEDFRTKNQDIRIRTKIKLRVFDTVFGGEALRRS
jgi:hypothetical protein